MEQPLSDLPPFPAHVPGTATPDGVHPVPAPVLSICRPPIRESHVHFIHDDDSRASSVDGADSPAESVTTSCVEISDTTDEGYPHSGLRRRGAHGLYPQQRERLSPDPGTVRRRYEAGWAYPFYYTPYDSRTEEEKWEGAPSGIPPYVPERQFPAHSHVSTTGYYTESYAAYTTNRDAALLQTQATVSGSGDQQVPTVPLQAEEESLPDVDGLEIVDADD